MAVWDHHRLALDGIELHYVRAGSGLPVVLLHGWPEFWLTWRKAIGPLAERFDVIAPDLRGFGESEKPPGSATDAYTAELHAQDVLGLADELGLGRFAIVSHDVGSFVTQLIAREHPERVRGLFFFNCFYPGIGRRFTDPGSIPEIWYQTFNQQPWAPAMVGASRESCRLYIGHFLSHWSLRPDAFDDDLEAFVDNFMRPGNLQGGFNWYIAVSEARMALMRDGSPELAKIEVPTTVRWGAADPVLRVEWADRLGDYFADVDFARVPDAGHFVHYERPELAVREITAFLDSLPA